jgi:FkbM family methyltransferase
MIKKVGRIYRKIKGDSNDQMFLAQKKLIHNKSDIIIFDVGANRGQTTEKYKRIFPMSTIYGFEPTQEVFACYRNNFAGDLDVKPINLALSDKNRVEEFYINKCDYTNSFFPAVRLTKRLSHDNDDQLINFKTIKTRTETVDNFCSKEGIKKIDILKIDIQGGELKVLKGASEMLDKQQIRLIYLEVEFVLLYEGQPLFSEISEYLLKKGYRIFDLGNLERSSSGQLVSGDALFISNKLNNKHD